MKIEQQTWSESKGWKTETSLGEPQLVLVFGSTLAIADPEHLAGLRKLYPKAQFVGCSTAGEIAGITVSDNSLVATAIEFEHTTVVSHAVQVKDATESFEAGRRLAGMFDTSGLAHLFVLSDGLSVNGSDLVRGLSEILPPHVALTGGLSGDGARFTKTVVLLDQDATANRIVGIGLYGDRIRVGYGSLGGWDTFGPDRLVTRSSGNVLYDLDNGSALELYKRYLGEHAKNLPASGLLFPLAIRSKENSVAVVRTILSVDEKQHSMTFAGDIPQNSIARLMRANLDRLIDGAGGAAKVSHQANGSSTPELAILISCVGRKLVLQQRVEEEVECVRDVLGAQAVLTGFYSYGEISPFEPAAKCELHNQTMTITTFSEKLAA
jgi:hypothetical protein